MSLAFNRVHDDSVSAETTAPHLIETLTETLSEVADVIAPVWPLRDYVAVNPYAGIIHRTFLDARAFLKVFSDCDNLMPIEYYAAEFQCGHFSIADIDSAIDELCHHGLMQTLSAPKIAEKLSSIEPMDSSSDLSKPKTNHDRPIRTIADYVTTNTSIDWREAIVDEISKHCAAHYDQGQASWASPYANLPLYQAWRTIALEDRNIEILGLHGFREYVAGLPHTPEAAIVYSLVHLDVPTHLWSAVLLSQVFSIPGWSAWAKYQAYWSDDEGSPSNDLFGLLAMRLAYDAALAESKALHVNWASLVENESVSFQSPLATPGDDSVLRYTLLRASEIAYRRDLIGSLEIKPDESKLAGESKLADQRKLAQMVFCIDVRSERMRRQLESQSSDIETFGFAGFFGLGFEYLELGQTSGCSQLPVLLKLQFKLLEGLHEGKVRKEAIATTNRQKKRTWRSLWKGFQTSATSCFSFVETMGLFYGIQLLQRALGYKPKAIALKFDGLCEEDHDKLRPTMRALNLQGVTTTRQVDMAEGMLRNLGLTNDFASLVVFCGHACQTDNNPLAAGLDCGACGGHSGEPNARFAALLLNQPYIRQALVERRIVIPDDTHFIGALHNTTTDSISFFDVHDVPESLQSALQELHGSCTVSSQQTREERLPTVAGKSALDLFKRASDWSEVRPEWGLAGNAAFIVAPRSLTKSVKLDARSFLHSYDYQQDEDGKVLETIMTAPMVVASWINLQYYASTVDNQHFGSGNKTVHNVVGKFGILSGNGGDLQTGLPWQSLHTGRSYQHLPMRLQVVIAAPREMIDRVIDKHEMVANLFDGHWLHLIAIDEGKTYRYGLSRRWEPLVENRVNNTTEVQ